MCENASLIPTLIWTFIGATVVLAILSRKLNDHLLVIPPQPTGPFAMLFRRKYHIRPRALLDPESHFDEAGLGWVKRFKLVVALALTCLLAIAYLIHACDLTVRI